VLYSRAEIAFLKRQAKQSVKKRARLCAHGTQDAKVHEMLLVLEKGVYIRPHKHSDKSESFHLVEGAMDVVIFKDSGAVDKIIRMGTAASGHQFFYRLNYDAYHTLILRTPFVVFHEVTNGPFKASMSSRFAPWAPEEEDAVAVTEFQKRMGRLVSHPRRRAA
jgi:cupin fold WbuC family metalloprotein